MRPESGVLRINNSVVSISGVTIRNGGRAHSDSGGIVSSGTLTLTGSIVSGNSGAVFGGILNSGVMTLVSSTVSGNSAGSKGGGILNAGTLTLTNSTVSANSAPEGGQGGGIWNSSTANPNPTLF
jgi:hypothetical protein